MSLAPCLLAATTQPDRRLIHRAGLDAALAFGRAQVTSRATVAGSAGTWAEILADTPRRSGPGQRLLLEGQRTNSLRNPRAEGAVAGNPGTLPTNWAVNLPVGLTREVVGTGVEGGVGFVDLRVSGTVTAGAGISIRPGTLTFVPAAAGQTWTVSSFLRLLSGSLPTAFSISVSERDGGGAQLATNGTVVAPGSGALAGQRFSHTRLLTHASTVAVSCHVAQMATVAGGTVVDFTLRVGWPQLEQAPFAGTPVLPAAGTPAASTRGADLLAASLAGLGLPPSGRCTLLWSGLVGQAGVAGGSAVLAQIDDGTGANGVTLSHAGGGGGLGLERRLAGSAASVSLGSMTPGVPFRVGLTLNGSGRAAACLQGGSVQALAGGPVSGLTQLRIGAGIGGAQALFGEVASLHLLPFALADAALPSAVAALPG